MAEFRGAVNVRCPSCKELLPTVTIKSPIGRFDGTGHGWMLTLEADLSSEWWEAVNRDHITCVLL